MPSSSLQPLPSGRRWLFRGLLALVLPLLALLLFEAILRLTGFGHPTSYFLREQTRGEVVLVENAWFGLSFFPPALARSPSPIVMRAQKPRGLYRIFLFGESAALGDPRPAYGMGRYLEALLREKFPGADFEVVCVAMTAINSHAVLPIARECARYQGDLWIVYMGNNEFAGPFGANTVFGPQAPPVLAVRAFLALQSARLGQWLVNAARNLRPARTTPASWGGLKMFRDHQLPPDDARRERVYDNFQRNLNDILGVAKQAGVPLILSSVASNLKDCPPFGSHQPSALKRSELAGWKALCDTGATNAGQGKFLEAVENYRQAAELSPKYAEVYFRLGQCLLAMTNFDAARESFGKARDLDTLPFRADSKLNELIASTARRYSGQGVYYLDAEQTLAPSSVSHIPGSESFYEHVHLNWDGNYRLALAFAEQAAKLLPAGLTHRQNAAWAEPDVCAQRLGLTDWNRYTILEEILRRSCEAPFTDQYNHDVVLDQFTNALSEIRRRLQPPAAQTARGTYEAALKARPEDHWLHHNYVEFLTNTGDLPQATEQMRAVCDLLPHNYTGYFQLGRLLAHQQKYDEAQSFLETALRLRPDVFEVRVELGQILAAQGKLGEALSQYLQAQQCHGDDARAHFLQADILARQGKRGEAIRSLREVVGLRPSYWEAHELLGLQLALEARFPEAQAEFEAVVRLRPDRGEGYLNLGIALARQHRFGEALQDFETTVRLEPQNQQARGFISTIHQLEAQKTAP